MTSESVVDQIVKSLSFEVEAVPQGKDVQPSTSSNMTPMNVKIRVRKKHESDMEKGIISVQKSPGSAPERMRLVSSDQTIMSFNVLMEAEFVKKGKRKPRKNFFGGCLGTQYDDDDGPYVPSSTYNAKKDDSSITSKSEGVLKQNFTLQKLHRDNTEPVPALTKHSILGKCKPGGCLDPPFGEDKYSYKPVEKDDDLITNIHKDEIIKKPDKKSDSFKDKCSKTVLKGKVDNESLLRPKETDSDSIITYPPEISSSQNIHDRYLRTRIINEEKQRNSATEGSDIFYTPAKRSRMESKDHKLSREGSSTADLGTEIPGKGNRQKLKIAKRKKGEVSAELEDITTPQQHIKSTSLDQNIQKEMKGKGTLHPKQTEIEKISVYGARAGNNAYQRSPSVIPGESKEQSSGKNNKMTKREKGEVSAEFDDITTPKDHMKGVSPDQNTQEDMKEKENIHPKQTGTEKISVFGALADNNVHQRSSNIPGEHKQQSNNLPDGKDIQMSKRKIGEVSAEFGDITTPKDHMKSTSPDQNTQGEMKEKGSTHPKQTGIEEISVYGAQTDNNVYQRSFSVISGENKEQTSVQDIKISKRKKREVLAEFNDITTPQHHMKSTSLDQNIQEEIKEKESIHSKQIGIEKKSMYDAQADNNLQPRSSSVIHREIKERSPGKDDSAENKMKHIVTPTSVPIAENYNTSLTSIQKIKEQKKTTNQTALDEIKYLNRDTEAFSDLLKDNKIKKENDKTNMKEYLSKPNKISADDSNRISSSVSLEELQNIRQGSADTSKVMIKPLQHTSSDKIKNECKDPEMLANLMMSNNEKGFKESVSKLNTDHTKNSKTSETFPRNESKYLDNKENGKTLIEPNEQNIEIKEKSTLTKIPLKYASEEKIDGVHRESENLTDLMSDDKPKGYESTNSLSNKEDGIQSKLSKPFSPVDSKFNEKEKETTYSSEYLNENMKENRGYDKNTPISMDTYNDPRTKGILSEKHTADNSTDKQFLSSYDNYGLSQNEVDDKKSLIKSTSSLTDTFTKTRTPEGKLYYTDTLQNQLADDKSSFDDPQLQSLNTHYQDGQDNKEGSVLSHSSQHNDALKNIFTYPQSKSPLCQNELENEKGATLLGSQQEDPLNNIFSHQPSKSPIASYQSGRTSEKGAISLRSQEEDVLQMRNMHPYYQDSANKVSSDLNAFNTISDLMDANQDSKHLLNKYSEGDDNSVSNTYYKPSSVMMEHKDFSGSSLRPDDIVDETTKVKDRLVTPKKLFADIEHTLEDAIITKYQDGKGKSDLTPSQYDLGATYQPSLHSSMFEENIGSRNHVSSKQYGAMTTSDVSSQRSFDKFKDDTSDLSKSVNDIRYTESSLKSSLSSGSKPYGNFEGSIKKEYDTLSDKRKNVDKRTKDSHGSLKRPLKDDLISLNLGFKSYQNDEKERILETFDTSKEPKRKPDDAITVIRTQIRARVNDLRIPIDSENEMSIQIRRSKSPLRVQIDEKCEASSTRLDKFGGRKPDRETQDLLNCIYERDLVPLHRAFKYLKRDLDMLAISKTKFKDKAIGPRRSNIIHIVKVTPKPKCRCWENW